MQKDDPGFASIGFAFSELEGKNSEHCCNNITLIILVGNSRFSAQNIK